jgi:hypothetical protein
MIPKCAYPNAQSAANHVLDEVKSMRGIKRLVARPFNAFAPARSPWWLVPTVQWPAYGCGKLFFDQRGDYRRIYCGLHIEKGVTSRVCSAYPNARKLVMREHWAWHKVSLAVKNGAFVTAIRAVTQSTGCPATLIIEAKLIDQDLQEPYLDATTRSDRIDTLEFEVIDDAAVVLSAKIQGLLPEIAPKTDLRNLLAALEQAPAVNWLWYNLYLGTVLEAHSLMPDRQAVGSVSWDAGEMWHHCLAPWEPWVW